MSGREILMGAAGLIDIISRQAACRGAADRANLVVPTKTMLVAVVMRAAGVVAPCLANFKRSAIHKVPLRLHGLGQRVSVHRPARRAAGAS